MQLGALNKPALPEVKTDELQLQVWDFGGQEIFYATHQFFLSDEAVYILAWTDERNVIPHRKRDKETLPFDERWRSCEYWLENIRLRAADSPIIMVQTHSDKLENRQPNAPNWEKEPFHAFLLNFSAAKDYNLGELKDIISDRLNRAIPMLGEKFPQTYENVILAIEQIKEAEPTITKERFLELCAQGNIDKGREGSLLQYLHKAGVVVYFNENALNDIVFINPNWLTKQVYRLINNELRHRQGRFDWPYLEKELPTPEYDDKKRKQFIELLKKFELIFENEENGQPVFIAPQYLPEQLAPTEQNLYDMILDDLSLAFVFRFPKFLPDNVMINFLSRYGPFSKKMYWKNGICFTDANKAKCIVEFEEQQKQLTVYSQDTEHCRALQREVCQAFVELSRNANAEISLDGKVFASWQDLEKYMALYPKNLAQQFFSVDGKTPLNVKDFARFLLEKNIGIEPLPKPQKDNNPMQAAEIKNLIAQARLKEALEALHDAVPTEYKNNVFQLQSRRTELESKKIKGIISSAEENLERNSITDAALSLCNLIAVSTNEILPMQLGKKINLSQADTKPTTNKPLLRNPKAFISYARKEDRRDLELFVAGIKAHSNWDIFDDRLILISEDWHERLQKEVQECDFAILLLSPYFFKSDYIKNDEFERFITRNIQNGFPFFSVLLADCDYTQWDEIARRQFFVANGQDYDLAKHHRDKQITFDLLARFDRDGELIPNPYLHTFYKNFVATVNRALQAL
mgnify:CR=1 FL=1